MTSELGPQLLFPAFTAFAERELVGRMSGALSAQLPRVLGQGRTRAEGLDLPPAPIERRQTLGKLELPAAITVPPDVAAEMKAAAAEAKRELDALKPPEAVKRFAVGVIRQLRDRLGPAAAGEKDGQYFAGRFILVPDRAGANWAWSLTKHYPVISRIPPDADYIIKAHAAALEQVEASVLAPDVFERRLGLSYAMAREFSAGEDVLIQDVARMYKIAAQGDRFFANPSKRFFEDVPDGALVANLIAWRPGRSDTDFVFVPATLNQSMGANAKAFFLPTNAEGTMTRPVIFLRRTGSRSSRLKRDKGGEAG